MPVIAQFANTKNVENVKIKPIEFILDLWVKTTFLSSLPIEKDPCKGESNLFFSPVQRHFICNTLIISSSSIHLFSCYIYLIVYLTILPGNLEQWLRPSSTIWMH